MLSGLVLHLLVLKSWKMVNNTFKWFIYQALLGWELEWNKIQLFITEKKNLKMCFLFEINQLII